MHSRGPWSSLPQQRCRWWQVTSDKWDDEPVQPPVRTLLVMNINACLYQIVVKPVYFSAFSFSLLDHLIVPWLRHPVRSGLRWIGMLRTRLLLGRCSKTRWNSTAWCHLEKGDEYVYMLMMAGEEGTLRWRILVDTVKDFKQV